MSPALPTFLVDALAHWGPRWHQDITAGRYAMFEAWAPLLESSFL